MPLPMSKLDYSSDSDSDSAPEEEGSGTAQQEVLQQLQEREQSQKREQILLKEQRRKQYEQFRKQREEKDSKLQAEHLQEMPAELLESLANTEKREQEASKRAAQRHITFEDDAVVEETLARSPIHKKNKLAKLRATAAKRGPVTVQVLSPSSQLPPKAERLTTSDREKWLRRRALRRK